MEAALVTILAVLEVAEGFKVLKACQESLTSGLELAELQAIVNLCHLACSKPQVRCSKLSQT